MKHINNFAQPSQLRSLPNIVTTNQRQREPHKHWFFVVLTSNDAEVLRWYRHQHPLVRSYYVLTSYLETRPFLLGLTKCAHVTVCVCELPAFLRFVGACLFRLFESACWRLFDVSLVLFLCTTLH